MPQMPFPAHKQGLGCPASLTWPPVLFKRYLHRWIACSSEDLPWVVGVCGLLLYLGSPTCPSSSAGGLPFPSPLEGLCLMSGRIFHWHLHRSTLQVGLPGSSDGKESACNLGDQGLIPGSGRYPGEENGNPLQHSCLEISMDRGAWGGYSLWGSQRVWHDWATNTHTHTHTHTHTQTFQVTFPSPSVQSTDIFLLENIFSFSPGKVPLSLN